MAEIKTKPTNVDVHDFINSFVTTEQKRKDSFALLQFFEHCTGFKPTMWGDTMIGFGQYHYQSDRSSQQGDWPLVGFSPRKSAISLYVFTGHNEHAHLLQNLGKFTMGKACIYVKKLSDIHLDVLEKLIQETIGYLRLKYGT